MFWFAKVWLLITYTCSSWQSSEVWQTLMARRCRTTTDHHVHYKEGKSKHLFHEIQEPVFFHYTQDPDYLLNVTGIVASIERQFLHYCRSSNIQKIVQYYLGKEIQENNQIYAHILFNSFSIHMYLQLHGCFFLLICLIIFYISKTFYVLRIQCNL